MRFKEYVLRRKEYRQGYEVLQIAEEVDTRREGGHVERSAPIVHL